MLHSTISAWEGNFMLSVGVSTTMRKQQHICTLSTHNKKREAQIVLFSYIHFGTMVISLEEKQIVQRKTLHITGEEAQWVVTQLNTLKHTSFGRGQN